MSVRKMLCARVIAALFAGALMVVAAGDMAFAQQTQGGGSSEQGTTRGVYDHWKVRCDTPPGSMSEQCIVIQNVVDDQNPQVTMAVTVYKTADGKKRMMRIIAPLGVLLPKGLGLTIDQTDVGKVGFVRCFTDGCAAEVVVEDGLLNILKSGQTATFIIYKTPEEGVGIPFSLTGFAAAYDSLPNVGQ